MAQSFTKPKPGPRAISGQADGLTGPAAAGLAWPACGLKLGQSDHYARATKYLLAYRRLMKQSTGICPRQMRQLYVSVTLPCMLYGIDVWFSPPHREPGRKRCSGSAGPLRKLESTQRIATLAITGALRTMPTDLLDLHANCHRFILT